MRPVNKQPVSYLQTDPRWRDKSYSARGEATTIGASGCGPTAMAMVLATWADPAVTPATECAWALAHGYKAPHQGTYYGYFVPAAARYGLTCRRLNTANIIGNDKSAYHDQAKAEVLKGNLVIACMGKGLWTKSGHYVLVWWIEGNTIYINDPASTRAARTRGDYSLFRQQVKYYWVIQRPAGKEDEPDMTEKETQSLIDKALKAERTVLLEEIKKMIDEVKPTVYDKPEDIPGYYKAAYETIKDVLKGRGDRLGLTEDMMRILTLLGRKNIV